MDFYTFIQYFTRWCSDADIVRFVFNLAGGNEFEFSNVACTVVENLNHNAILY